MSEEEIIKTIKREIKFRKDNKWYPNCIVEPKILQGLLDLYNKEKEKAYKCEYFQEVAEALQEELKKDKEKNKALETEYLIQRDLINADFLKDYIHKDKIQKIVDECIPKKENIFTGELEYSTNANANSFLAQEILKLLNKE